MTNAANNSQTDRTEDAMKYTAINEITGQTIQTNDGMEALRHIGPHVHVTTVDGFTHEGAFFRGDGEPVAVFWAELTGNVRYRVRVGKPQGTVKGRIVRN